MSDEFDEDNREESLPGVVNAALESFQRRFHRWLPAKVIKFDGKNKVDVQVLVQDVYRDEGGERQVRSFAVVSGIPVEFFGSDGFRVTVPISDGTGGKAATTGAVMFAGRSLDKWLAGDGGEVDPQFDHDNAMADAKFFPGLQPFGNPWQSVSSSEMTIGSDTDGNGRIHFGASEVKLGDGATKGVARTGDKGKLLNCSVQMSGSAVSKVTIAGIDLTVVPADIADAVEITDGSDHIKAVD